MENFEQEEYNKIIESIRGKLTEDKNKNLMILKDEAVQYKDHKYSKEIIKEIGRMIFENVDDKTKEEFSKALDKDINNHFEKGKELLEEGNSKEAKKEFEQFVSITKTMYKDDNVTRYYSPFNELEYLFICDDLDSDSVKDTGINFSDGYLYIGIIEFNDKNYEEAKENFVQALRWNPYNFAARMEFAEVYKMEDNIEEYKNITEEAYQFVYNPKELARYYRNMGYYYIEKEEWFIAKCIYLYSLQFDQNDMVMQELGYIFQKTNDKSLPLRATLEQALRENQIPTMIIPRNYSMIALVHKKLSEENGLSTDLGKYIDSLYKFFNN